MCYFKNVAPVHMETHKENSAVNWLMPGFRRTEYVIRTHVFVHFAYCRAFFPSSLKILLSHQCLIFLLLSDVFWE